LPNDRFNQLSLYRPRRGLTVWLGLSALQVLVIGLGPLPASASSGNFDVVALGATTSGKLGDVVKVKIGIKNTGPDTYLERGKGMFAVTWKFRLPPGTETVKPPETELGTILLQIGADVCWSNRDEPFGPGPYDCWSNYQLKPGESSQGTFYLKITNVIPNATGTVERSGGSLSDNNPDNDKASVIINPDPEVAGSIAGRSVTWPLVIGGSVLLLLLIVVGFLLRLSRRRDGTLGWPEVHDA